MLVTSKSRFFLGSEVVKEYSNRSHPLAISLTISLDLQQTHRYFVFLWPMHFVVLCFKALELPPFRIRHGQSSYAFKTAVFTSV